MSSSKAVASSRAAVVAFAIVASILVVATAPAAAATQDVVVSIHITDTDFESGTLTDVAVSGTGESASIQYNSSSDSRTYSFTGSNETFTVPDGVAEITVEAWGAQGRSARFAAGGDGGDGGYVKGNLSVSPGDTFTIAVGERAGGDLSNGQRDVAGTSPWFDGGQGGAGDSVTGGGGAGSTGVFRDSDGAIIAAAGGGGGGGGGATDDGGGGGGARGGQGGSSTFDAGDDAEGTGPEGGDGGNAGGQDGEDGDGLAHGDLTDVTTTKGGGSSGTNHPNGTVTISWEMPDTAQYISANHTVENSDEGFVNLTTVTNGEVDVLWETTDGSGWSTLNDTDAITTASNHSFTWSSEPNSTVRVTVDFTNQSGNGDAFIEIADEGVIAPADVPTLNDSTASPTGTLSTAMPTLSIDANDSDFDLAQGDSVDVEFFVEGSSVGTDTLTSNGTASVSASISTGGDHTWNATATDSYGLANTSGDFAITVPSNLSIRTEREPHSLITNSDAVLVYERTNDAPVIVNLSDTDNDGNISLEGLPITTDFVVSITAPGYHNRTILIESIYEQQSAFLLDLSVDSVETRFLVDDRTGDFDPPETQLVVQRAINRSIYGETPAGYSWTSIAGDDLGADSAFVVDLEEERRYRIVIQNNAGDSRILGSHVAQTTGTHTLKVGQISWAVREDQRFNWTFVKDPDATPDPYVRFTYRDLDDNTTDIDGVIFEVGNRSNVLTTFSGSGPYGDFVFTQTLTSSQAETDWQVEFNATRDGEQFSTTGVTGLEQLNSGIPVVLAINTLSSSWQEVLAGAAILITSFIFTGLFSAIGGILVAAVGAILWMVGGAPWSLAAVLLALVIGVVYRLSDRTGGL